MSRRGFCMFVLLCGVALINGEENGMPPQPSSAAPNGTSPSSKTTPLPSSTTPITSTTTSTSTPTTTNSSGSSTTPISPTTAPPKPGPAVGHYVVKENGTTNACIIADLAAQVWISQDNYSFSIILPSTMSSANSSCTNETDSLILTAFDVENEHSSDPFNVTLTLKFMKDNSTEHYKVTNVTVDAIGAATFKLYSNKSEFSTPLSKSYRCAKEQNITLNDRMNNRTIAALTLSHVQFEAFHGKNDTDFGAAIDCQSSFSPDIVPIAVGCALAGLIAIVMIAYLVGRRRSQARGYLSM